MLFRALWGRGAGGSLWGCWSVGSRRGRKAMVLQFSSFLFIVDERLLGSVLGPIKRMYT